MSKEDYGTGLANPDFPPEYKPINFYINKHRYKGQRGELVKIIGDDLKVPRQYNLHTLYLYNTLDPEILHGMVYVH